MDIRVINLDRSPDRLAGFLARNHRHPGISRVPAVDGRQVDRRTLLEAGILDPAVRYTDGAVGVALTQLAQWDGIRRGAGFATILEDDAILCANFEAEAARRIDALPPDWDLVLWGYNFDTALTYHLLPGISRCMAQFDQDAMRRGAGLWPDREVSTTLYPLERSLGIAAYSVSPRGAQRLFDFCVPIRPMLTVHPGLPQPLWNAGIDNMMANHWPMMRAYVAVPPLALTRNEWETSTVQEATGPDAGLR